MTAAKFLVAVLIVFTISGEEVAGTGAPPPVSDAYLQRVARSLKKYVDPLPTMPKSYGYAVEGGRPKPIVLTVGMYEKKWVISTNNLY